MLRLVLLLTLAVRLDFLSSSICRGRTEISHVTHNGYTGQEHQISRQGLTTRAREDEKQKNSRRRGWLGREARHGMIMTCGTADTEQYDNGMGARGSCIEG
jgi:hypothetical protein